MAVDDGSDDAGKVAVWLDFVEFTGLEERSNHCPVSRACAVKREERGLSL